MIVETYISSVCSVIRRNNATDVGHVRHAGKLLDAAPVLAAVFSDVQHAIIGADVDQSVFLLRLSERGSIAEESRRSVLRHGVDAPDATHHRQLVAIEIARELTTDRGPTIARSEEHTS